MMEYGLIGERLGHSYSPLIHRCFGAYDYRLCPLPPEEVPPLLERREFKGLNVTIPYKQTVLPFCDGVSDTVRQVGSANTLISRNGRLIAHNTDLPGFLFFLLPDPEDGLPERTQPGVRPRRGRRGAEGFRPDYQELRRSVRFCGV